MPCAPEEMTPEQRQFWHEKFTLLLSREVFEVLDETEFKPHRKIEGKIVRSNLTEELVDIFKYWMCLCQLHGMSPEEFMGEYHRKSYVVKQRFYQENVLKYDGDIVGVDIDGVLADYPRSFVEFLNEQLGLSLDYRTIDSYDVTKQYAEKTGCPLSEAIRVKHIYRDSGQKRFIPVIDGARQFLNELKYMGYIVVLLTSRPIKQYKRIFADTQFWLADNKLHYDAILFDEEKGERLFKEFGKDRVKFFVDDVAPFANGISDKGIKCYLINKPYNDSSDIGENVMRVNTLEDILELERSIVND